jgi:hypothetical protein
MQETKHLSTIASYMQAMATTIQVSAELVEELKKRKMHDSESYESVIWDLLEDTMELSPATKERIKQSRKEIDVGRTVSLSKVKKELGI